MGLSSARGLVLGGEGVVAPTAGDAASRPNAGGGASWDTREALSRKPVTSQALTFRVRRVGVSVVGPGPERRYTGVVKVRETHQTLSVSHLESQRWSRQKVWVTRKGVGGSTVFNNKIKNGQGILSCRDAESQRRRETHRGSSVVLDRLRRTLTISTFTSPFFQDSSRLPSQVRRRRSEVLPKSVLSSRLLSPSLRQPLTQW